MFPRHRGRSQVRSRRSSALVITLAILVLICGTLLAFLSLSTINRQISFSSAGQYRADSVAHTALDTITGDLRTEIVAGSQLTTINGSNIYLPNPATLVTNLTVPPARVGDQGYTNLVKESMGTSNFWAGASYSSALTAPVRSAANNNSQTPSLNGRYIKMNRWNQAGLLGDPGSGTTPSIPNTYLPPDWVVVTRQGAISNAMAMPSMASLSDKTSSNYAEADTPM